MGRYVGTYRPTSKILRRKIKQPIKGFIGPKRVKPEIFNLTSLVCMFRNSVRARKVLLLIRYSKHVHYHPAFYHPIKYPKSEDNTYLQVI